MALLLRHACNSEAAAAAVENAVEACLKDGIRTHDVAADGHSAVSTDAFGGAVIERLGAE